jgi:anti-anti-sigma factor
VTETNEAVFWVRRDEQADAVILRAGGELDAFTTDELAEHLREAEEAVTPPAPVVLDLTGLTYLSSAGVATLVIHAQRFADMDSRLRVVADQPAVLRPLTLTGADDIIDVVPALDDAEDPSP